MPVVAPVFQNNIVDTLANPWTRNTYYPPGSGVRPTHPTGATPSPITASGSNDAFELGNLTGWTADAGWSVSNAASYKTGTTYSASLATGNSNKYLIMATHADVANTAGYMSAKCFVFFGNVNAIGSCNCAIVLRQYASNGNLIKEVVGTAADNGYLESIPLLPGWYVLKMTDVVFDKQAATVALGVKATNGGVQPIYVDAFSWDLMTSTGTTGVGSSADTQIWYAVQTSSGPWKSGANEPDWSNPTGSTGASGFPTVIDGSVVWDRAQPNTIDWRAAWLYYTGYYEPGVTVPAGDFYADGTPAGATKPWPNVPGVSVPDPGGSIDWLCVTPIVTDKSCPQSKVVTMGASKIYSGNGDIVNFCATLNCMDWSAEANAGFLATGLQAYGDNPVAALGLYRSNLVVFNANGFQMWSIDEDPGNMQLLDAKPLGCRFQKSLTPINDDLFFLTDVGIRSMGISASSGQLMAGDVGMPIDPIVHDALAYIAANPGVIDKIASIHYPGAGQFWFCVPGWVPTAGLFAANPAGLPVVGGSSSANYTKANYDGGSHVLVYTQSRTGEVGAWSHYNFPCHIECFCILDDKLYIKADDYILYVAQDYYGDTVTYGSARSFVNNFPCVVQWPWLDLGQSGGRKKTAGFDIDTDPASGAVFVEFGYDQSNPAVFSPAFTLDTSDTVPGMIIPLVMNVSSLSPRITFNSVNPWKLHEMIVYTADQRVTA